MGEPKSKSQPVDVRALDKALGKRHPDEGKIARDFDRFSRTGNFELIALESAMESILQERDRAVDQALFEASVGHRTFPTSTAVGYATPMMRGAQGILERSQQDLISKAQPFFTDPDTGEVAPRDMWEPMFASPRVPVEPAGAPTWARTNQHRWPAPRDKTIGTMGAFEPTEQERKKKLFERLSKDQKEHPVRNFVQNLLGLKPQQQSEREAVSDGQNSTGATGSSRQ